MPAPPLRWSSNWKRCLRVAVEYRFRSISKHNFLVIGGDMKAQIGKNGNHKFILLNTSNRNGHLTDFTIENRLTCLNTNFQKRTGKLWTSTCANNTKARIDYVFINKKCNNSPLNYEAYSSFEVGVLRSTNCLGKNTTEYTKECDPNKNHHTLRLGLA